MNKNKISFKNINETEGNLLLLKAEKVLSEPDISHYKFYSEYIEVAMQYYNSVFETFLESLSISLDVDPKTIKKSYRIDIDFLKTIDEKTDEEKWFFKTLMAKIGSGFEKLKKLFLKFNINKGKPLEPFRLFGKAIYDPKKKKYLTNKEVQEISDGVVKFLKTYIGSQNDELIVRSMLMGKFAQKLQEDGKTEKEILNTKHEEFEKEYKGNVPSEPEEYYKKYKPERITKHAMQYAINNSGKYLAVERSNIKNSMVEYTQKLISDGLAMGRPRHELVSDFYYKSKEMKNNGIEEWNRDIQRIILTETKTAFEGGKMIEAKEHNDSIGKKTYMLYGFHVNPEEGIDEPCNKWLGKIGLVVDEPRDSDATNDPNADFLIWAGKTNIGRNKANAWACIPSHPKCKHTFTQIDVETQMYNKENGLIEYRTLKNGGLKEL